MTSHFISDHLDIASSMPLATVAHWLHATLTTVGWEPLAKAMATMLTRWRMYALDRPLGHGYRLVASLAGVADHPVCPRLDLPFVLELIKLCWTVITTDLPAPGDLGDCHDARGCISSVLLLEAHVLSGKGWFTNTLPTILCIEIDTYLLPANTIERHVAYWMQREPFDVVAPSLVSATKRNPQLRISKRRAALADALTRISSKNMRNVWGFASALALVAQPWPTTMLQNLWEKMVLSLLPVLFSTLVTHDLPSVSGLSDVLMDAAQAFELPRYQRRLLTRNYGASSPLRGPVPTCSSTRRVLDALEYDAEKRSAFVDIFLAATASKPEANTVFRNLELRESAFDVCLAKAGLERLPNTPLRGSKMPKLVCIES
ncbi:hypothetical protein SDRG_10439 [Saprolegnia diclina VS20]|uniref:Uncharacterized protein n=1 Tax=Saprolegnia diclina (strain VS20) TaxID=1156394 RepID=T0RP94_SAPDV|nr:hypothetical protein SDRG_10439 [Saprolegnia diclina VS20]EQC31922.1 hypothetical protein SDRG_10439 [Saprolegnia diclina VS20]|eukprot:XP_008614650.1 hypothetical protein SDRG_10439 [Saprolegnia diclina VS20]